MTCELRKSVSEIRKLEPKVSLSLSIPMSEKTDISGGPGHLLVLRQQACPSRDRHNSQYFLSFQRSSQTVGLTDWRSKVL